ncbi:MAG: LppM family (lipo)protein, partial [Ilumatobacteraceae bacterium]
VDLEAVTALLAEEGEDIDPTSICDDMLSDADFELAGEDAEVKIENDGTVCRQILTGSWEAGATEIVDDSGEDLSLTQVGDGWRFELDMESLTSDLDDDEEMDPAMLALMGIEINYSLTATLPGSITEHNGELSGNTVSWEINLLDPPEDKMLYVQSTPEGSSNAALVIVIIIALVLLAGVSIFLLRRKTESATTLEAETSEVETAEVTDPEGESSTE